ncbi:MAG: hypothetical protein IT190_07590 [Microbacteriaceae bacterium]|nr:hypothetical protein [Microbacteriaceae bacterium]
MNDDESIAQMRVLRMGPSNKKFAKRYATLAKKFKMLRGDKMDLEKQALRDAFVETCLLDWKNIENIREVPEGTLKETYMPFNKENADLLLESLPELFDYVVGQAMDLETFQTEVNEEAAKNSFPTSNTN